MTSIPTLIGSSEHIKYFVSFAYNVADVYIPRQIGGYCDTKILFPFLQIPGYRYLILYWNEMGAKLSCV